MPENITEKKFLDYLDTLDRDVEAALSQLVSAMYCIYRSILGNVGWSTKDQCWKIFDFDILAF